MGGVLQPQHPVSLWLLQLDSELTQPLLTSCAQEDHPLWLLSEA